ncbi:sugar transferase [filamentous cyanobacterium LEGE 11480]|uniref:Sugar transferase n=1 Tax=Romeriopsis navalis LEGE 11480 TaxID=2777977 RepID=A0A928Z2N4_9CYAN|nr:sugar transferase [Romeriopsis navalis]MBE9029237.1 sugar transferase [Romeriopsis navalis LEGE 11480]
MTAKSPVVPSRIRTFYRRGGRPPLLRRLNHPRIKRLVDIAFSLFALTIFAPFYLTIAALVALTSPGPVFYVQKRVGKDFRAFGCIKFRTMVQHADLMMAKLLESDPEMQQEFAQNFKLKHDPRITPIGHFLRVTSLDEFPQFWNVLMGDMSVVGPRPLVPEELVRYGDQINRVLTIRPGITGLWQVSGRNDIPYPQRVRIDSFYVSNHHVGLDIKIAIKTIGVVLFPKGNGAY